MLTFTDFLKRLAHSQLKNTSAVDDSQQGEILPEYYETILSLTNQGLEDLSVKLPLFYGLVDLTFVEGQNVYPLTAGASYLDDSVLETFSDEDFIKVSEIQDEDGDIHTPKTNGHILCPNPTTLRFTTDMMEELGAKVRIKYQKKHPELEEAGVILLPAHLYTPLQLFVASLYISHMGSPEHTQKGDAYFATYLRYLSTDEEKNTSSTSEVQEDTRFDDRGFV